VNPGSQQRPLRILVLNWRDPKHPQAGGAETLYLEQAKRWIAWGHQVDWLTSGFRGAPAVETIDGIAVRRVGNAMTMYVLVPFAYLLKYRGKVDVILDAENGIPFFSPLFARVPRICVMHHVHREVFRKHLPAWLAYPLIWCEEKLMPFVYRNSRFVAISEDTRHEMIAAKIAAEGSIGLVRCGVGSSLRPGEKASVPTVLYLGRLKAYKRVDLLIDAFARVRAAIPNAVLRIAGAGDARETLEARVRALDLSGVTFEGFVDEEKKQALLQDAWVTVSPSEMEGWGITVIEANACATPAIAFSVPGLREAIVDGVSGLVVPEGSDLAEPVISVLANPKLRARLERGALARAAEFTWDGAAKAMLDEITGVIERRRRLAPNLGHI